MKMGMKMRTIFRTLAVCLFAALLLGGIGAAAESAPAQTAGADSISLFMPYMTDTMINALTEYERLTGTRTEVTTFMAFGQSDFAVTAYLNELRARIDDENPPDIVCMPVLPTDAFVKEGVFADLSGLVEGREFDENILAKYRREDGLYTLPVSFSVPVLLANRNLLDEASLELADGMTMTMPEFVELCRSAAEKLPDGVAVYGAASLSELALSQVERELNVEGYTYFDPYEREKSDFDAEGFAIMLSEYIDFSLAMEELPVSGFEDEKSNIEAVEAGELLFARCELRSALEAMENSDALEVVSFPSAGKNPAVVLDAVSVPADGNTEAALGLVEYLLGDFQKWLAEHEWVALDDAANREYYTGGTLEIVERAKDVSFYDDYLFSITRTYPAIFMNMDGNPESVNMLEQRAWNIKSDVDGSLERFAPEKVKPYMYVVIVVLYVLLVAGAGASVYLIAAAVVSFVKRGKAVAQTGRGRRYGEVMDTVYERQMESTIIAIIAALFTALMFAFLFRLDGSESAVPLVVRKQLMWILISIGLFVTLLAVISSLFTKLLLCERAIVMVSGLRVRAVYVDSIERIYMDNKKECLISTNYSKPLTLRCRAYRNLAEKLKSYAEKVDIEVQQ